MPSIINATVTSGLTANSDVSGNLIFQTSSNNVLTLDNTQNATFVNDITSRNGLVPGELIYRLNSTVAGADSTAVQKILGVGVTVSASTVYQFELVYTLNKSAGAVSHAMQLSFGGTATLNNISYDILVAQSSAAGTINGGVLTTANFMVIQQATATTINSATTNTTSAFYGIVKGTVSINAGGTFIPQYTLTAAPGGAYTTQIGSYFKLSRIGASGANTSIGTWV